MTKEDISKKIEIGLKNLREGKMIVLSDKNNRENEGDIVMAAQFSTPEKINFMITYCRGLVCAPISREICDILKLPPMVKQNQNPQLNCKNTNFSISVDHESCTTGISAHERSTTLQKLADSQSKAQHFIRPGHIFPLISNEEGLKSREGHTEATVELLQMANLYPVGVICEIINDNGFMAREAELKKFCEKHDLFSLKIEEIIQHKKFVKKL